MPAPAKSTPCRPSLLTALLWPLAALLCVACAGPTDNVKGGAAAPTHEQLPPRARNNNLKIAGFTVTAFDLNADGRNDQVHYSDKGALVRIHRDLNFDGVEDTFEHYKNNQLVEEEIDMDLDSTIDVVLFFENGHIVRKMYAMGFRADLVIAQFFDQRGRLSRIERDTNDDGVVDLWEHYKPNGDQPFRIEIDEDGDGKPDRVRSSRE